MDSFSLIIGIIVLIAAIYVKVGYDKKKPENPLQRKLVIINIVFLFIIAFGAFIISFLI
jgi:hypothetical protein